MSQSHVDRSWAWTNACFKESLLEEYPNLWRLFRDDWLKRATVEELKQELKDEKLPYRSPTINERYLAKLKDLSTDKLCLIVKLDQTGEVKRHGTTIDVLLTELMERSVNGEG